MKPATFVVLLSAITPCLTLAQPARLQYSSREEFRTCYLEGEKLTAEQIALRARGQQHQARLKQHQDDSRALFSTQTSLNTDDEKAVDDFNQKVNELNSRVETINRDAELLNREKDELNFRSASINKRCAGMIVRQIDRDAVLKELAGTAKRQ